MPVFSPGGGGTRPGHINVGIPQSTSRAPAAPPSARTSSALKPCPSRYFTGLRQHLLRPYVDLRRRSYDRYTQTRPLPEPDDLGDPASRRQELAARWLVDRPTDV